MSAILTLLRDGHPRRKADLVEATGWARATVSSRLDSLVEARVVQATDTVRTAGRPSSSYALSPRGRLILAAQIAPQVMTVGLIDLLGEPITHEVVQRPISADPTESLTELLSAADRILDELGRTRADLLAVGVGLPGPVDQSTALPMGSSWMRGWEQFGVAAWLTRELGAPTLVDNIVNLEALVERAVAWPEVDDLLFVRVGLGVGAGIFLDGAIRRGSQGAAGDIGHMRIAGSDAPCQCGGRGCLNASVSGPAIAAALTAAGEPASNLSDVVRLVNEGSRVAIEHVRTAGQMLGTVLASCVSILNPKVIVIGGPLTGAGDHFLAGARESIYSLSLPFASRDLQVVYGRIDALATLRGAGMLALDFALATEYLDPIAGRG